MKNRVKVKMPAIPEAEDDGAGRRLAPEEFLELLLSGGLAGRMNESCGRLVARNDLWDFVLGLAFHDDPRVAFRAAWTLEWAYFDDRDAFMPYAGRLMCDFIRAGNGSVHRHYLKILLDLTRGGRLALGDGDAEKVAEKSFGLLISPQAAVAVKVSAMEMLYDLSARLGWVGEHLPDVLRDILDNAPSAGTANRASKILRRINEPWSAKKPDK